ncbi:MAG: FAD-binding protein [Nitriliruptorales bacterium]|nr:FAD-binding protein [Nitriliruptorales bacterium]
MPAEQHRLLTGWGRTAPTAATVVPLTEAAAQSTLKNPGERGVIARGLGRSYGDAAQNAGGVVLDGPAHAMLRAFDATTGVATLQAGVPLDALLRAMVPLGWFVPVTPGTRFVTVGGAVAADIHGKNHHVDGSFANHVTHLRLATPAGERTCSPEEDPDLFWATLGGMGLTGVILEAGVRLLPIATAFMRVDTERATDLDDLMARMALHDHRYRYSVAWIDCVTRGRALGRAVLTRGDHAELVDLPGRPHRAPLQYDPHTRLTAPSLVPSGVVRPGTAFLLNEAWYRKAPKLRRGAIRTVASFFHPLDGVRHWNRMYGKSGFLQYQFVVPFDREDVVRTAIQRLTAARCPSVLAVLKRFGAGNGGHLSFPQPGWSLALDLPVGTGDLPRILDELDVVVVEAGGRVYLAKDSRMSPEFVPVMYPRLSEWRAVCDRVDPDRVLQSDLDRRLALRRGRWKEP